MATRFARRMPCAVLPCHQHRGGKAGQPGLRRLCRARGQPYRQGDPCSVQVSGRARGRADGAGPPERRRRPGHQHAKGQRGSAGASDVLPPLDARRHTPPPCAGDSGASGRHQWSPLCHFLPANCSRAEGTERERLLCSSPPAVGYCPHGRLLCHPAARRGCARRRHHARRTPPCPHFSPRLCNRERGLPRRRPFCRRRICRHWRLLHRGYGPPQG
mmetsp:Transcript_8977/g.37042  ORF Transcript_8977/g.37042 Transcript_8977/m.37042 type:complete len:216 (-) Transcript_8977:178-825(-)